MPHRGCVPARTPPWSGRLAALCAAAVAAVVLRPGPALAQNLLVNGSFESGEIDPWSIAYAFDPAGVEVLAPGRADLFALHLDAAEYDDHYSIVQSISPTATELIGEVSLWTFCPTPRWGQSPSIILHYDDGTWSQQYFPLVDEWTLIDATAALEPAKVLEQFELNWGGLGDEGPGSELFVDDIAVVMVPAPAPAAALGLALGLAGIRRRRPGSRVRNERRPK